MRTWSGPPLLSAYQARPILEAMKAGQTWTRTSFDLGLTPSEVQIGHMGLVGPIELGTEWLRAIAKEPRKVFRLDTSPPTAVRVFSDATGWVRSLCPTRSAPTVLVSGIPMHRIKDTDPMEDTKAKLRALGAPGGRVLDTATGLGYTAIEAAKSAAEVVTVELDPGAIEIARLNPWSAGLFDTSKIVQRIGDIAHVIAEVPTASFEAVLHDPPTASLGGDLYGLPFYKELRRVLKHGGRLFHYVGDPASGIGAKMYPGVMKRLSEAGFSRVERHPKAFGVTAAVR